MSSHQVPGHPSPLDMPQGPELMNASTGEPAARHSVLVVDDEPNICSLLCDILKDKYDVTPCAGVVEALSLVKQNRYDVVVTDLRMPDGNGIDILREAKKLDDAVEVIIITAYASLDTAMSAVNLGASSYLTKPVSLANFVAQVGKAIANRQFRLRSRTLMDHSLGQDAVAKEHFATITHSYDLSRKLALFLDVSEIMKTILCELNERLSACACTAGINLFGQADIFAMAHSSTADREALKAILMANWDAAFGFLDRKEFSRERAQISVFAYAGEASFALGGARAYAVPMIVMGRTIGSLVIFRDDAKPLSTAEYQFVHVFSSLASPLVESCYVHQRTKLLASTDGLTGVSNHRAFHEMLTREIARTDRDKTDFCLCLIDIDDFKKVNDTYGHLVGDAVLKDLCERINPIIREGDILARYGGEEFGLILPTTPTDGAVTLSERIRSEIDANPYKLGEVGIHYTISIGISLYSGKTPRKKEALIRDADDALYASKSQGKNRVIAQ